MEQIDFSKTAARQSVFGIISLASGALAFIFLLLGLHELYHLIYIDPVDESIFLSSDLYLPAVLVPLFIGIILGIAGLFQKHRKKTTAIIGLILCLTTGILACLSFSAFFIGMALLGLSGV